MAQRLADDFYAGLDARLAAVDAELAAAYPGEAGVRQPVHTAYVPAHRFVSDTPARWGRSALELLAGALPDAADLADVAQIPVELAEQVRPLVVAKLEREPIEDLRIDFEDGYGPHTEEEEDAAASAASAGLAATLAAAKAPPFTGIRIKCLEPSTRRRGLRTLDLFLDGLLADTGTLPAGFVVTLAKVSHAGQVEAFAAVCAALENAHQLSAGVLRFELQIETPQSVLAADGRAAVAPMLHAGQGRVSGLHYGTYDYSAACGVSAGEQSLAHPVADHAKAVMQVAAAGTGVHLSDGSSNVLPVGTPVQIMAALRQHAALVHRSLGRAYYQGWDLHPGQLITRYTATYAFYRAGFPHAADRLAAYVGHTGSTVLDEPATAQAMASLLMRGIHSGALTNDEVGARAGVSLDDLDRLYRRRVG